MGLHETMFGLGEAETCGIGLGFQGMAAQRLSRGLEPIDWETILLNQLRAEQQGRQLTEYEQFLLESLSKA